MKKEKKMSMKKKKTSLNQSMALRNFNMPSGVETKNRTTTVAWRNFSYNYLNIMIMISSWLSSIHINLS